MMFAAVISAAWGVAEATLFFVVPDVIVGWLALRRPRQLLLAWAAATLGGVFGAVLVHTAVRRGWGPDAIFRASPGMQSGDIELVRRAVSDDPTRAFALGAVSGIPVKIYVAEAARQGVPLADTLRLVALNRAPRIGAFGLALALSGLALRRRMRLGTVMTAAAYGLGWAVFYTWYWVIRKDPDEQTAD